MVFDFIPRCDEVEDPVRIKLEIIRLPGPDRVPPSTRCVPMLTDFSIRLALGLSALLLTTTPRVVPVAFFRTHCLVILGLLVLGALSASTPDALSWTTGFLAFMAFAAYLASVAWGLGLPRLAYPLTLLISIGTAAWLIDQSTDPIRSLWAINALTRIGSSFLMGSTVSAMLLGHYYLTAPTMSIAPLQWYTRCMTWGLVARAAVALIGLGLSYPASMVPDHRVPIVVFGPSVAFLLLVRWGMGLSAPALATWMAWKTEQIRSTQSATGILYIATTLIFFGELTAMVLARDGLIT
jgi:hypothetical protein